MAKNVNPKYPLFIVSKGRADSRLTVKALERMNVPYRIVVESQEFKDYNQFIPKENIVVLDKSYQRDYDTFDELGMTKSVGPGAARNFVWDIAQSEGAKRHWVMDDNISGFWRLYRNRKILAETGAVFRAMEDFSDRYLNVAMSGPNYFMFASRKNKMPPIVLNTRIYSCNLIQTDLDYRWRGRYNEDTDLSLRMLKDGYCTIQFNGFLQYKMPTQTVKGGNKADFYDKEGTLPKSEMLVKMHPDVARLDYRFSRIHHYVDYSPFKRNRLKRDPNVEIPKGVNEYGMKLGDRKK